MIPHNRYLASDEDREAVARVLDSGHVAQGPEVHAFEQELEERFGRPAAVVSSGTAALYLALRVSGVWEGDSVLIPTYACTALYHAVRMTGASVELGDIEASTFNLSPAFQPRHRYKAVIYVHTYGVPGKVPTQGVVISDCSHALGASYDGVPVTMMGDLAVASLGPTKLLATPGCGVVFGSEDRIAEIRDRRDYDQKETLRERFNFASNDVIASMGRVRLARLDSDYERRHAIASQYALTLRDGMSPSAWYRYPIRGGDPGSICPWLKALRHFESYGIETINPLRPDELLHRKVGEDRHRFENAEGASHHTLSLPMFPELTDGEVAAVCYALGRLGA